MRWLVNRLAMLLIACCFVAGCQSEPRPQSISGKITFDGTPIAEGKISFVPSNPAAPRADGLIKDGSYTIAVFPGSHKVEIYSPRPAKNQPKQLPGPGAEAVTLEESIPSKYNHDSQLTVEVTADKSDYDFTLTSR